MSIGSLDSNYTYSFSQTNPTLQNLASIQHKKLDTSTLINLNDSSNAKSLDGLVIKDKVDLQPLQSSNGITLHLLDDSPNTIDSSKFESFLNSMRGLNKDQISALQSALNAASETMSNSQTVGGTYGMRITQTNLEFKYISEKLIPEQYQDQFNSFVDNYTNQLSSNYVSLLKCFADQIANRNDPVGVETGWQDKGKTMLDSLENGTYSFQTSENQYKSLYNRVDVTNSNSIKEQLESVYKDILSNAKPDADGASRADVVNEIKYLSDSWNTLMDALGDQQNKLTTSVDFTA